MTSRIVTAGSAPPHTPSRRLRDAADLGG